MRRPKPVSAKDLGGRGGTAGSLANDSLHSVGEPAPVGDRVCHAIGQLVVRVEVCDDLGGGVGSGNATESSPVREMCLRPPEPMLQALVECGSW